MARQVLNHYGLGCRSLAITTGGATKSVIFDAIGRGVTRTVGSTTTGSYYDGNKDLVEEQGSMTNGTIDRVKLQAPDEFVGASIQTNRKGRINISISEDRTDRSAILTMFRDGMTALG